jgi:hypothetical protein
LIDRSGDVGHHARPKHFGFPPNLHPGESEIVDAVFQSEKPFRGELVESCKLRHFNSFELFDHTGRVSRFFLQPDVAGEICVENLVLMRKDSDLDSLTRIFSQAPSTLIAQSRYFTQGEALISGEIVRNPTFAKFEGRLTLEGGGDAPIAPPAHAS